MRVVTHAPSMAQPRPSVKRGRASSIKSLPEFKTAADAIVAWFATNEGYVLAPEDLCRAKFAGALERPNPDGSLPMQVRNALTECAEWVRNGPLADVRAAFVVEKFSLFVDSCGYAQRKGKRQSNFPTFFRRCCLDIIAGFLPGKLTKLAEGFLQDMGVPRSQEHRILEWRKERDAAAGIFSG